MHLINILSIPGRQGGESCNLTANPRHRFYKTSCKPLKTFSGLGIALLLGFFLRLSKQVLARACVKISLVLQVDPKMSQQWPFIIISQNHRV